MRKPVRIEVRVSPNARSSAIVGRYGNGWKARIAAAPEKGNANEALTQLLAEMLSLSRARVRIVAGAGSRSKTVEIDGPSLDDVQAMLEQAVGAQIRTR